MPTLLLPERRKSKGTGHLRRCVQLLAEINDAAIYVPEDSGPGERSHEELAGFLAEVPPASVVSDVSRGAWDTVVVDLFSGPAELLDAFSNSVTIGIDVGGPIRELCSYVIDTLPRVDGSTPNEFNPSFLALPEPSQLEVSHEGRVLVSFGGEDPAGLTEPTVRSLLRSGVVGPDDITVMRPSLRRLGAMPDGVAVLEPVDDLSELIRAHEWVITSFGLTAYEAASVGRIVLLANPTAYHGRLATESRFASTAVGPPSPRKLRRWFADSRRAAELTKNSGAARDFSSGSRALANRLSALRAPHRAGCPVHRGVRGPVVWRGVDKSYFTCPVCGLAYLERFSDDEESYSGDYFADEYQAQYGRTYAEDFAHIREMGKARLRKIMGMAHESTTVLDVGCALGPFLSAAEQSGLAAYGVDVSEDAVAYATKEGLRAAVASVVDFDPQQTWGVAAFDIVTLWYVVEHFYDLDEVLCRLCAWVRPGGILAMSTPHGAGVSRRTRSNDFFRSSPRDHYTVWDRRSAKRILDEFGFSVMGFRITGHHPDRYPILARRLFTENVLARHSKLFRWGDTFEIYARRRVR